MPVLENPVNTRLEIIKLIYCQSGRQQGKPVSFFAAQIDGGYYSEIHHQMKFLKEKGLLDFTRNMVSKRFKAELTEAGVDFMEKSYEAVRMKEPERSMALEELFKQIKV